MGRKSSEPALFSCDEVWVAWAAGLLEGEGNIRIARTGDRARRYPCYAVYVTVIMCHRPTVEKFGALIGANIQLAKTLPTNRKAWRTRIGGLRCLPILQKLLPFLISKKPEAKLAIKFLKRQKGLKKEKKRYTTKEIALCERYKNEMSRLKRFN